MRTRRIIAVDAHKASFTYVVLDDGELIAGPTRRSSTEEEIRGLVRKYTKRLVIVEACGVHEWMADVWLDEGADVFVARPFKQDRAGDKSDGRDAKMLGQRYLSGELKRVYHPPPEMRLLRSIVRERSFLVKKRTQVVNHMKHELNRWNLHHLSIEEDVDEVLARLPHLASNCAILRVLNEQIKPLDKLVDEKAREIDIVRRLQTIPGFGPVVSLAFYAEIGNIERFPTAESLVKYLGIDPAWRQSGDTRVDLHRISKAGRPMLRGLLCQAAWAHTRCAPQSSLTHKYKQLVKRKGAKALAIMSVTRRLAEAGHRVWRQGDDFTVTRPAPSVPSPTPLDEQGRGATES